MDIMRMGDEPKFLGSWDLYELPGQKMQVTIKAIREEFVENTKGQKEKKAVMHFVEDVKPMILNIENKKRLAKLFSTKNNDDLAGKRIEIGYERVKAFGDIHDALRIVPRQIQQANPKPVALCKCESCGGDIHPTKSMTAEEVRNYTKAKLGKSMCSACANKAVKAQEEQANAQ